jgi:catechol 2,3-dioxygenase-like lactoylglutathione lyase family enzyme
MTTKGSATTFQISNFEASLAFYTGILGFTERFRFGDYVRIGHGDHRRRGGSVRLAAPGIRATAARVVPDLMSLSELRVYSLPV